MCSDSFHVLFTLNMNWMLPTQYMHRILCDKNMYNCMNGQVYKNILVGACSSRSIKYVLYCFYFIGPMINVTIEPYIVTSFVTPPYNTFTLNCTASVRDTILVPKTFHWRVLFGAHEMNLSSNTGSIMITNMNLNAPTSNSILRVTANISGSYQYICTAVLQFPGVEDDITGISSANVTVRGM